MLSRRVSLLTAAVDGDVGRHLTGDICKQINDKQMRLLDVCPEANVENSEERKSLLLNLFEAAGRGDLETSALLDCLKELGCKRNDEKESLVIGDVLWMTWLLRGARQPALSEEGVEREQVSACFASITRGLIEEGYLTRRILMEISEGDFMEVTGLISSYMDGWRKREIRANTRNVYAQKKYNLLREESEGYSKVITLLNQSGAGRMSPETVADALAELESLVGYFDLDPNRVASLVLDSFAASPENDSFIDLIRGFGNKRTAELLGFRLSSGHGMHPGVYRAAAKLVRENIVSLEDLIVHFGMDDAAFRQVWEHRMANLKESVKRIGVISLSGAKTTDQESKEQVGVLETDTRKVGQTAKNIIIDTKPYIDKLTEPGKSSEEGFSQRMDLLAELFGCDAWEQGLQFVKYLRTMGVADVCAFQHVGRAVCLVIREEISCMNDNQDLSQRTQEALELVNCHLHYDAIALTKVVRLVKDAFEAGRRDFAQRIMVHNVLPSFSLVPGNAALTFDVWGVLEALPYEDRFLMYSSFEELVPLSDLLVASQKLAETEVRRILRRVTAPSSKREAKLTMRPVARLLAKVSHANPFIVCKQLLRQVMGMPGMVVSVSESLKYLSPLMFDVLTFSILKQLSSGKRKLKDDGVNLEEWFQWLASFTGLVCRHNSGIEVRALLQFIVNQLKGTESLDLLVLKEIISTMTGILPTADVSNQQLDTLAGSDDLILFVLGHEDNLKESSGKKETQRATSRLLVSLQQGASNTRLMLPLLLLLAQQRKLIALHPPSRHLKLAAEMIDKCQEVALQYVQFLQKSIPMEEYCGMVPSIQAMAQDYKIDLEIILEIYRPIIRGLTWFGELGGPLEGGDVEEEGEIEMSTGQDPSAQIQIATTSIVLDDPVSKSQSQLSKEQMEREICVLAPDHQFHGISWQLFLCFWTLKLQDLKVPDFRYEQAIKQIKVSINSLRDTIANAKKDTLKRGGPYSQGGVGQPQPPVDMATLKAELAKFDALANSLPEDQKTQQSQVVKYRMLLKNNCSNWVIGQDPEVQAAAAKEFVQYCILPRLFLSPADAMYCAEFLQVIHQYGPCGLRLLSIIDRLFKELGYIVRCCTPKEAVNLGIFFADLLGIVSTWRQQKVFQEECAVAEAFKSYKGGKLEPVSHDEFVKLSANWHKKMTLDVFKSCIASEDYMQMKNVLLVLNRMVRIYPATKEDCLELLQTLKPISEKDTREDLKTLARMYCTGLEMSMRDRLMVPTRQEYAGLPPPRSRKRDRTQEAKEKSNKADSADAKLGTPSDSRKLFSPQEKASLGKDPQEHADPGDDKQGKREESPSAKSVATKKSDMENTRDVSRQTRSRDSKRGDERRSEQDGNGRRDREVIRQKERTSEGERLRETDSRGRRAVDEPFSSEKKGRERASRATRMEAEQPAPKSSTKPGSGRARLPSSITVSREVRDTTTPDDSHKKKRSRESWEKEEGGVHPRPQEERQRPRDRSKESRKHRGLPSADREKRGDVYDEGASGQRTDRYRGNRGEKDAPKRHFMEESFEQDRPKRSRRDHPGREERRDRQELDRDGRAGGAGKSRRRQREPSDQESKPARRIHMDNALVNSAMKDLSRDNTRTRRKKR